MAEAQNVLDALADWVGHQRWFVGKGTMPTLRSVASLTLHHDPQLEVKILRVDADERKIGLSRKRVEWAEEDAAEVPEGEAVGAKPSAGQQVELRGGVGSGGPLIQPAKPAEEEETE